MGFPNYCQIIGITKKQKYLGNNDQYWQIPNRDFWQSDNIIVGHYRDRNVYWTHRKQISVKAIVCLQYPDTYPMLTQYHECIIPKTDIGNMADHLHVPTPRGNINIGPPAIYLIKLEQSMNPLPSWAHTGTSGRQVALIFFCYLYTFLKMSLHKVINAMCTDKKMHVHSMRHNSIYESINHSKQTVINWYYLSDYDSYQFIFLYSHIWVLLHIF